MECRLEMIKHFYVQIEEKLKFRPVILKDNLQ